MSSETTLALDEDVLERLKAESRLRGKSVSETLNELLRSALRESNPFGRTLKIEPMPLGLKPGLGYDDVEALIEYAEGPAHR